MATSGPNDTARQLAAARQRRRRERLKEMEAQTVTVLLSKDQAAKLDYLLALGYAPDKSSILAKGIDEAYERETRRVAKKTK